jgi:hypothetical protein
VMAMILIAEVTLGVAWLRRMGRRAPAPASASAREVSE